MSLLKKAFSFIGAELHKETQRLLFNILLAFVATFTVAHLYSLFVPLYVFLYGYHIHHFYYGMFLLAVASIVGILTNRDKMRHILSYIIGVGIGLIVDELGLLLNCTGEKVGLACQYLFPNTFDIVTIVSVILLLLIFFGDKPVHWFLPKSWQNNRTLNTNLTKHIDRLFQ